MMASNNYIMSGGNDYNMLADLPKYGEAGGELETVQSYLESCMKTERCRDMREPETESR